MLAGRPRTGAFAYLAQKMQEKHYTTSFDKLLGPSEDYYESMKLLEVVVIGGSYPFVNFFSRNPTWLS